MAEFNLNTSEEFAQSLEKISQNKNVSQGDVLVMALGDLMIMERVKTKGYKIVVVDNNDVIVHDYIGYENTPTNKKEFIEFINSLE